MGVPASRPPKLYTAQLSGRDGRGRDGVPIVLGEAEDRGAAEEEVYWLPKPWASAPPPASSPQVSAVASSSCTTVSHRALRGCICIDEPRCQSRAHLCRTAVSRDLSLQQCLCYKHGQSSVAPIVG